MPVQGSDAKLTHMSCSDMQLASSVARRTHAAAVSVAVGAANPGGHPLTSDAVAAAAKSSAAAFRRLAADQMLRVPAIVGQPTRDGTIDLGPCKAFSLAATFEMWVRLHDDPNGQRVTLLHADRGGEKGFGLQMWTDGESIGLSVNVTHDHAEVVTTAPAPMVAHKWYHLALRTDEEGGDDHPNRLCVLLGAQVVVKSHRSPWFRNKCHHLFVGSPWTPGEFIMEDVLLLS